MSGDLNAIESNSVARTRELAFDVSALEVANTVDDLIATALQSSDSTQLQPKPGDTIHTINNLRLMPSIPGGNGGKTNQVQTLIAYPGLRTGPNLQWQTQNALKVLNAGFQRLVTSGRVILGNAVAGAPTRIGQRSQAALGILGVGLTAYNARPEVRKQNALFAGIDGYTDAMGWHVSSAARWQLALGALDMLGINAADLVTSERTANDPLTSDYMEYTFAWTPQQRAYFLYASSEAYSAYYLFSQQGAHVVQSRGLPLIESADALKAVLQQIYRNTVTNEFPGAVKAPVIEGSRNYPTLNTSSNATPRPIYSEPLTAATAGVARAGA
jgi:hypothetical protein